jgi:EAL domain-containing protein (putative c-di-GMP-specific phosphodiesterase class I)
VHVRGHRERLRPALRVGAGTPAIAVLGVVVLLLVLAGGVAQLLAERSLANRLQRADAHAQRAEALSLGRVLVNGRAGAPVARGRLAQLLSIAVNRPGTEGAALIDDAGRVVTSAGVRPVAGRDGASVVRLDAGTRRYSYVVARSSIAPGQLDEVATILLALCTLLLVAALGLRRGRLDPAAALGAGRTMRAELRRAVAHAARHVEPLSLVLLHAEHRLSRGLRARVAAVLDDGRLGDRPFCVGPDALAVLLPRTGIDGAVEVARRFSYRLANAGAPVRAAAGALQPGQDADQLHAAVEALLRDELDAGPGAVLVPADRSRALDAVLELADLTCHYQPIWHLDSGTLLAVEALARLPEEHGFEGPAHAFDVAEHTGRVHELDVLCVTRALEGAEELPQGAALFVNVAPQTLDRDGGGESWLADAVTSAGLRPEQVVVEVTERMGARTDGVLRGIEQLRAAGLRVAIDDVGIGNSGLEMLRRVRPDFVKIDRAVVRDAPHDPGARAVLVAIAAFATETGACVIAEGIEDDGVLDLVRGVDGDAWPGGPRIQAGQGFGLGRPLPEMPSGQAPRRTLAAMTG